MQCSLYINNRGCGVHIIYVYKAKYIFLLIILVNERNY